MVLVPYFLIANLTVSSLFVLIFALVSIQEKNYQAPRWFTVAWICAVFVGLSSFWILTADKLRPPIVVSYAFLMLVFLAMIVGLQNIYRQKTDWHLLGMIFLAAIVCNLLIYDLPRASFLYRVLYQLPLCVAQLLMIRIIYRSGTPRLIDKLLLALAVFSCIYYLLRAFMSGWPGSDMRVQDQTDAWHVIVSMSSTLFVQVTRGLLLLLITVSYMVGEASEQSDVDPLSQIYNRRGFDRHVARLLARKRGRIHCSVIMSDLDFFKQVNDTYGHEGGDRVIAAFGKLLKSHVPRTALAARMGGEEFVVFMPDADLAVARTLAQELRLALSKLRFENKAEGWGPTASFGVAELAEDESLYETMRRADGALYEAKKAGRNCVQTA